MSGPFQDRASTLSQRARVAAEQPGEGIQSFIPMRSLASWKRWSWAPRAPNIHRATNFRHHPIESLVDFVVGETQLDKSIVFDFLAPIGIALRLSRMMSAIELDRNSKFIAAEIYNKTSNRNLPAKFQTAEAPMTQLLPKDILRGRIPSTQATCNIDKTRFHVADDDVLSAKPQPLTRRLRRHPLPLGESQRALVDL